MESKPKAFLWRIEVEGAKPSYLFGTIHIPDDRIRGLFPQIVGAFDASDVICTEVEFSTITEEQLCVSGVSSEEKMLEDILHTDLYERVVRFLEPSGISLDEIKHFTVGGACIVIMLSEHLAKFGVGPVLDGFLHQRAQIEGKETACLETVESQIASLQCGIRGAEITMLRNTIDMFERLRAEGRDIIEELLQTYFKGKSSFVARLTREINDFYDDSMIKKAMKSAFDDRNESMAKSIIDLLKNNKDRSYFFAIGVGHLVDGVSGDSVVALLRKGGYKVTRIEEG